jgi:hypothetical protein
MALMQQPARCGQAAFGRLGIGDAPLVFTAGRLVRKKGFEYRSTPPPCWRTCQI